MTKSKLGVAPERAWQKMTLTKVGRLGDLMQAGTGSVGDGEGQGMQPKG